MSPIASGDGNTAPNQPEYKDSWSAPTEVPDRSYESIKNAGGGQCDTPDSNDFEWFYITDSAAMDQKVTLARPRRKITLVQAPSPQGQSKIYLSFVPSGKGISPAAITGKEQWFQFRGGNSADPPATIIGSVIRFCKPVTSFYISVYSVGGASVGAFAFVAGDDLDHCGFVEF